MSEFYGKPILFKTSTTEELLAEVEKWWEADRKQRDSDIVFVDSSALRALVRLLFYYKERYKEKVDE